MEQSEAIRREQQEDGVVVERPAPLVLNMDHFRRFTLGNAAFEEEIFGLFLSGLPETVEAMGSSVGGSGWRAAVHKLRGSALGIGAERLSEAARAAEHLPIENIVEREAAIGILDREIEAVVAEIRSLCAGAPG